MWKRKSQYWGSDKQAQVRIGNPEYTPSGPDEVGNILLAENTLVAIIDGPTDDPALEFDFAPPT